MKIFIQKSNRSIRLIHRYFFNSTYHHDLFSIFRQKFSFQKNFQKSSLQKSHLIKDRIFKIHASKFPRKLRSWKLPIPAGKEKKSERIGKKFRTLWEFNWRVFLRQFLRLATVIALVNLQNNHVEASPPREAWQHVTRRAARVGCSRGGVARSTCLWRAPTSCPTLVQSRPRAVKGHRKGGMRRR